MATVPPPAPPGAIALPRQPDTATGAPIEAPSEIGDGGPCRAVADRSRVGWCDGPGVEHGTSECCRTRTCRRACAAGRSRHRPSRLRACVGVGGKIREPRSWSTSRPIYPELARQTRVQGAVILEAMLDATGRVESVRVLESRAAAGRRGGQRRAAVALHANRVQWRAGAGADDDDRPLLPRPMMLTDDIRRPHPFRARSPSLTAFTGRQGSRRSRAARRGRAVLRRRSKRKTSTPTSRCGARRRQAARRRAAEVRLRRRATTSTRRLRSSRRVRRRSRSRARVERRAIAPRRREFPGGRRSRSTRRRLEPDVYVREGGEWKLVREGPAVDALADDLDRRGDAGGARGAARGRTGLARRWN